MKKLVLIIGALLASESAADLYDKAQQGIEPYATHFAEAENLCLDMGYSYPGFIVPTLQAELRQSEMNLCIEREINNLLNQEEVINKRLFEIEQKLQELLQQRKELLS